MPKHRIDFEKLDWETPVKGVRNKIFQQGSKQIRLVEYTKEMPPHWCEKGHYGLVLNGVFEIEYANEKIVYKSGDGVFIPDGENHKH
ncbi:MAG TPA: hypothetical protein ENH09_00325, partial [Bacteroidetes bacterium]|nr:hypothetical protein [Bacteroidota bacterium]